MKHIQRTEILGVDIVRIYETLNMLIDEIEILKNPVTITALGDKLEAENTKPTKEKVIRNGTKTSKD